MKVKDFMSTKLITCKKEDSLQEAAKHIMDNSLSILPVVCKENILEGLITTSDFLGKDADIPRAMVSIRKLLGQIHYDQNVEDLYENASQYKLEKVMSTRITSVEPETSLNEAVNIMIRRGHKRVPVVKDGKLVGIITRKDLVKAFYKLAEAKNKKS